MLVHSMVQIHGLTCFEVGSFEIQIRGSVFDVGSYSRLGPYRSWLFRGLVFRVWAVLGWIFEVHSAIRRSCFVEKNRDKSLVTQR
jgi:hypothetical protein